MTGLPIDPVVSLLVQASLALLFATAALHKVRDLPAFEAVFFGYELVPRAWAPLCAHGLVLSEFVIAGLLLWGLVPGASAPLASMWGSAGAVGSMVVYALAISVNLVRGRHDLDCGCMGPAGRSQTIAPWLVLRNAVVAVAAGLIFATSRGWLVEGSRSLHWVDALTLAGGLGVVVLVWVAVHGLAAVWTPRFTEGPA